MDLLINTWEIIKGCYGCRALRCRLNYLTNLSRITRDKYRFNIAISLLKCEILILSLYKLPVFTWKYQF